MPIDNNGKRRNAAKTTTT